MPTTIEWTHPPGYSGESWNPVTGCTKVSPGCAHCYAEAITLRFKRGPAFLPGIAEINLHSNRLELPMKWSKPRCVFVNSMSDLFHPEVPVEFIERVFAVMAATPRHLYLILTKRPELMRDFMNHSLRAGWVALMMKDMGMNVDPNSFEWPPKNVWCGTSVENQHFADVRIPILRETKAAIRWISMEPMLGPIDMSGHCERLDAVGRNITGINKLHEPGDHLSFDWLVIGGESGPKARPMNPRWAIEARDAAWRASIPVFFKQWGKYAPTDDEEIGFPVRYNPKKTEHWLDNPVLPMIAVGKNKAGALLEGQHIRQFPGVVYTS